MYTTENRARAHHSLIERVFAGELPLAQQAGHFGEVQQFFLIEFAVCLATGRSVLLFVTSIISIGRHKARLFESAQASVVLKKEGH